MTVATYDFTKVVYPTQLKKEIEANSSITVALAPGGIRTSGSLVYISFKEDLPTSPVNQQTILAGIVSAHTPDFSGKSDVQLMKLLEEPAYLADSIDRTYQAQSFEIAETINANATYFKSVTFPYDIVLLGGEFSALAENVGDSIELVMNPNGTIGSLDADIASGATSMTLPDNVVQYVFRGYNLKLADGTNTDDLGRVLAVAGNLVTFENATTHSFAAATPTAVICEYYVIPHLYIRKEKDYEVGKHTSSGACLRAGIPLVFRYNNATGATKIVPVSLFMDYYF